MANSTPCSVEGCDRTVGPKGARGMCSLHYKRWKATGTTDPRQRPSALARLLASVAVDPITGCWNWTGAGGGRGWKDGGGYSAFYFQGRLTSGHRASYIIANGSIPDGLTIDHLCRNTRCVNPAHLEAVTNTENIRRGNGWAGRNARVTHCPSGHPYDADNTSIVRGQRRCKACNRRKAAELRERRQR